MTKWCGLDSSGSGYGQLAGCCEKWVMNFLVPQSAGNSLTSSETNIRVLSASSLLYRIMFSTL
jgi:hypothetical protein